MYFPQMKFFVVVSALVAAASAAPQVILPAGLGYASYPYTSTIYTSGTPAVAAAPTAVAAPAVTLPAVPAAGTIPGTIPGSQASNILLELFSDIEKTSKSGNLNNIPPAEFIRLKCPI